MGRNGDEGKGRFKRLYGCGKLRRQNMYKGRGGERYCPSFWLGKGILRHAGLKGGFPEIRGKTFSFRYAKFEMPVGHPNGGVFVLFALQV